MNVLNEPLDILFRKVNPEEFYHTLLAQEKGIGERSFWAQHILEEQGEDHFFRGAEMLQERCSQDEINYIHGLTRERAQEKALDGEDINQYIASVFYLLPKFTENILSFKWGEPLCDKQYIFSWREMSLRLGQDIMTTAHCAFSDRKTNGQMNFFAWPTAIHINNPIVEEVIEKGVSENHAHLLGSVPPFHMTWVCLMNHPNDIYRLKEHSWVRERFDRNMLPALQYRPGERQMSSVELLQIAFWLRVHLYRRIRNIRPLKYTSDEAQNDNRIPYNCLVEFERCKAKRRTRFNHIAEQLRYLYGKKFRQSNGSWKCLDYAFPVHLNNEKNENHYRVLAGERYLLYRCFYECFSNGFTTHEQDIFYLYLLLKSWFRQELIQVNHKVGFRNFSDYQERKDALWYHRKEYVAEGYRIAVNGNMQDHIIKTQENRITPGNTKKQLLEKIGGIDQEIIFSSFSNYSADRDYCKNKSQWMQPTLYLSEKTRQLPAFYTLHFIKAPDQFSNTGTNWIPPRNAKQRHNSKMQALALAQALVQYPYLRYRIRGIDACTYEIGCRPETYGTEFRFLRHFRSSSVLKGTHMIANEPWPRLCATYHAGEDFLDIIDGIRAIDEAITFLELERGDRLGHALALGLEPKEYYHFKKQYIVTTKQNRLDDLVWLLYRSGELNVSIPLNLYRDMENEARRLLEEIYGNIIPEWGKWNISLQDYYFSWKLRGDHPDFFTLFDRKKSKGFQDRQNIGGYHSIREQYLLFQERQKGHIPEKSGIRGLIYYYHFDRRIRRKGAEKREIRTNPMWEQVVREVQNAMIMELTNKGIYIECNPTSNFLISVFSVYQDHPLFRFNEYWTNKQQRNSLCISINTDDMGVFDTSIENEYALVAAALEARTDEQGNRLYSDDAIKDYLEQLRIMGHRQTFRPLQGNTYTQQRYNINPDMTI